MLEINDLVVFRLVSISEDQWLTFLVPPVRAVDSVDTKTPLRGMKKVFPDRRAQFPGTRAIVPVTRGIEKKSQAGFMRFIYPVQGL